ncbi:MAG: hypothetical protein JXR96_04285 [Deltaproteobacteria bacterium]|nr:hypothetical protein [Deltaproteobacteria bacterium]
MRTWLVSLCAVCAVACGGGQPVDSGDCEAGAQRCDGERLEQCADGAWSLVQDCSLDGQSCEMLSDTAAECRSAGDCSTGQQRCSGELLEYCDRGSWVAQQNCALGGESCVALTETTAECRDLACQEGDQRCDGEILEYCLDGEWSFQQNCGLSGLECVPLSETAAECRDLACQEGARRCDGEILEYCLDGEWSFQQNCGLAGLECVPLSETAAECQDLACQEGARRCDGDVLEYCRDGEWSFQQNCGLTGLECVPLSETAAECRDLACQNGDQRCDGDVLEYCLDGGWTVQQNCGLAGLACVASSETAAQCQAGGCAEGEQRCLGDRLEACADGEWALLQDCALGEEHCVPTSQTTAVCQGDGSCENGRQRCLDDILQRCVDEAWTTEENCGLGGEVCVPLTESTAECRCQPDCDGRLCGGDGCGGTCGTCATGTCNEQTGQCEVGEGELRVQLRWDTADTDLDLRILRGSTTDYCSNDSCYYANCVPGASPWPEWDGDSGRTPGDPVLELDDIEGFGPELVLIQEPVDATYRVAVHYWGPGTGARSWASVSVFVGETLIAEDGRMLDPHDLWEPFRIEWDAGSATVHAFDGLWRDVSLAGGSCVVNTTPCEEDRDCPADQYCAEGVCAAGCRDDGSCTGACGGAAECVCNDAHLCVDPNAGTLGMPCVEPADCSQGEWCSYDDILNGILCEMLGLPGMCSKSCHMICDPDAPVCPDGQTCGSAESQILVIIGTLYGADLGDDLLCY